MQQMINLTSDCFSGILSFIFLRTIFSKKASKLPVPALLFLFCAVQVLCRAMESLLPDTSSVFRVLIHTSAGAIVIFLLSFFFAASFSGRILAAVSYSAVQFLCERFSGYVIEKNHASQVVLDIDTLQTQLPDILLSEISLLSDLLIFFFLMLLKLFFHKHLEHGSRAYAGLLLTPLLSICLALSPSIFYLNLMMPRTYLLLIVFLLFINVLNYVFIQYAAQTQQLRTQVSILSDQITYQNQKYMQLSEAYKNIRSFMHDTKKHLFFIESCVRDKKYDNIISYSQNMQEDLASRYCTFNTGNLVIDAFASNLLLQTKKYGITLSANLKVEAAIIPVNDYHLTIILGNLIDNALNACMQQSGGEINLTIQTVNDTFTIYIANTFLPERMPHMGHTRSMDIENVDFIHGYGLKNVKDSVAACQGICLIRCEDDLYTVTVIVPISAPSFSPAARGKTEREEENTLLPKPLV
jgi:signal transduction histidine kinase